jgi:hypothetical protein
MLNPEGMIDCDFPNYNSSASTFFHTNYSSFQWEYEDGTVVVGNYVQDALAFGDVVIQDANFAVSNFTNTSYGVMGLSYPINEGSSWYDDIIQIYQFKWFNKDS